jgi:hypothetical protein
MNNEPLVHFKSTDVEGNVTHSAPFPLKQLYDVPETPHLYSIGFTAEAGKATTTNPKDILGDKKVSLDAVSPFAILEESLAMMDGEMKYGYRNWRDKAVRARVYVNAAKRHLDLWLEGQERATDSKVHHLGHARACLGIILDAQATNQLVDDRNNTGSLLEEKLEEASKWVAWRKAFHKVTALLKAGKDIPTVDDPACTELADAAEVRDRLEAELTDVHSKVVS